MRAADIRKAEEVAAKLTGEPSHGGYFAPDPRPWWKRAIATCFPRQRVEAPNGGLYMRTYVDARFDWKDRLRILISGHVLVETLTETDVQVGFCRSRSAVNVLAPGERV